MTLKAKLFQLLTDNAQNKGIDPGASMVEALKALKEIAKVQDFDWQELLQDVEKK
jgi:hypothetical protein